MRELAECAIYFAKRRLLAGRTCSTCTVLTLGNKNPLIVLPATENLNQRVLQRGTKKNVLENFGTLANDTRALNVIGATGQKRTLQYTWNCANFETALIYFSKKRKPKMYGVLYCLLLLLYCFAASTTVISLKNQLFAGVWIEQCLLGSSDPLSSKIAASATAC